MRQRKADDTSTRWPLLIPEAFATAEGVTHHSSGDEDRQVT